MKKRLALSFALLILVGLLLTTYLALNPRKQPLLIAQATEYPQSRQITIEQVRERHEAELMAISGVVGVAIGECESQPCIKVYLKRESSTVRAQIPTQIEGFRVETEVIGSVEASPK